MIEMDPNLESIEKLRNRFADWPQVQDLIRNVEKTAFNEGVEASAKAIEQSKKMQGLYRVTATIIIRNLLKR